MSTAEPMSSPVPIVLAGARGHGRWHPDNIRRLQDKGIVRLAGVCELTPLTPAEIPEGLGTPEQSADWRAGVRAYHARRRTPTASTAPAAALLA